jgi:hypothetical protein
MSKEIGNSGKSIGLQPNGECPKEMRAVIENHQVIFET